MATRFSRKQRPTQHGDARIDVWLNPSAGQSASQLAGELAGAVHLVVVPKTGTRIADVAVLTEPDPVELEGISRLLPQLPLLATTRTSPSELLRAAANRAGARLLTDPTPAQLLDEITTAYGSHR
jgi:hypothetical protein